MIIKERKIFDYEEKIAIVKEVKKVGNRTQVAHKYDIGENSIRAWEKDLQAGRLRKEKKIVLPDLFDCKMKTDLIEFCEMIKDEVTDKFKSTIIIPFMVEKGYKKEDLIQFFEVSKEKYNKFVPEIIEEDGKEYKII